MKGISFVLRGELAHFRNPFTQTHFDTYLAPPKTTINGLIGAARGKNRKELVEQNSKIKVGVEIVNIEGFLKEIVNTKNLKGDKTFTPVTRKSIVQPKYKVYVGSEESKLLKNIKEGLKSPSYPLYLGISDFLATVEGIKGLRPLEKCKKKETSTIIEGNQRKYVVRKKGEEIEEGTYMIPPKKERVITKFEMKNGKRKPQESKKMLMFYNCKIEFNEPEPLYSFEGNPVELV